MAVKNSAAAHFRPRILSFLCISLSAFALAAETSAAHHIKAPTAEQRETLAQNFVKDKLHFWQNRLNLGKWDIHADLVRSTALKPKTLGNIHWDIYKMQAVIDVQSSYDYKLPFQAMLDDMEFTVVHELVHLQLASLPRSEASRSAEEYAVNQITEALLKLAKR